MRQLPIILVLLICPFLSNGQEINAPQNVSRNTIYLEAFGQGLYNSISFDRLLKLNKKIKRSVSTGLTLIPSKELFVIATPISYNYLIGEKSNHHLELGIGFTPMFMNDGNISVITGSEMHFRASQNMFFSFVTPKIGYRYQRSNGGLFFRLTFTPPIAGINVYGNTKGQGNSLSDSYVEGFRSAAFFGSYVFPWGGMSIGWTLKNQR
jgi:hypothetical protein